jgi:hypothetical protein
LKLKVCWSAIVIVICWSSSALEVIMPFTGHHFTQSLIAISFTQCFMSYFQLLSQIGTKFDTSSLPFYGCHITTWQNQNHSIIQTVITLWNVTRGVWNECLCVGCSHSYQLFHMHDWWCSTQPFWELWTKLINCIALNINLFSYSCVFSSCLLTCVYYFQNCRDVLIFVFYNVKVLI